MDLRVRFFPFVIGFRLLPVYLLRRVSQKTGGITLGRAFYSGGRLVLAGRHFHVQLNCHRYLLCEQRKMLNLKIGLKWDIITRNSSIYRQY